MLLAAQISRTRAGQIIIRHARLSRLQRRSKHLLRKSLLPAASRPIPNFLHPNERGMICYVRRLVAAFARSLAAGKLKMRRRCLHSAESTFAFLVIRIRAHSFAAT